MKAMRDLAVVGLGELLWDELPGGRRLGGAPANFAVLASRLGVHGILASRLGQDEPGDAAREQLGSMPVDSRFLQTDAALPTGTVSVRLQDGQPAYTIHAPVAWDALEFTPAWAELAARADAVCWGTLAQRDARSEETIHNFLAATGRACLRAFDVNLREPFFAPEAVLRSIRKATLLKLNDAEMPELLRLVGLETATPYRRDEADITKYDEERTGALAGDARRLLAAHPALELVAITLGGDGSLLVTRDHVERHPGVHCKVVDTVGAGDAFTAALVVHRLSGASLAVQSEAANRWGSWVASQSGAMPALEEATRTAMETSIAQVVSPGVATGDRLS
ncbi:PfkB family carbohydrate kinase [Acidipila sp. EB88]|uniref:PfkB family carbohydrate kinase n=1 Tax=Acidipila sp. EB88 TaxID=2305226 RepID=UPI000F5E453F|nr:PfkB family carbohydrate kinase [Acidipila sp. EB88]RRA48062.1 carbohydrate kinase [Acidipila sp. EB88]